MRAPQQISRLHPLPASGAPPRLTSQAHPATRHSSQVYDHDNWDFHRSAARHVYHIAGMWGCVLRVPTSS